LEELKMKQVLRYHPLLVALHWALAFLIIAQLILGFAGLATMPNSDPQKIGLLALHMAGGVVVLVFTVVRFGVRIATSRPAPATTGYRVLDRLAPVLHDGSYVLILLMVGTGFATAILSGVNIIVFGPAGNPLPPTLMIYPSFLAHIALATLLATFIAVHVIAALYHQFARKDALLQRMVFGRPIPDAATAE
jgi:cytochrome b561